MAHWSDTYDVEKDAVVVNVHVQPGAGRTALVGRHGHALKLRVAAPPVDNRANEAAAELLADLAGVAKSAVSQVSGEKSRVKRFRLEGADSEVFERAIDSAVDRADEGSYRKR